MMGSSFLITLGSFWVPSILLLGRIDQLNDWAGWRRHLVRVTGVAVGAWLLHIAEIVGRADSIALSAPIAHLVLFRILRAGFIGIMEREPVNVSKVEDPDLTPDRMFFFIFTMTCLLSVFAAVFPLITPAP